MNGEAGDLPDNSIESLLNHLHAKIVLVKVRLNPQLTEEF